MSRKIIDIYNSLSFVSDFNNNGLTSGSNLVNISQYGILTLNSTQNSVDINTGALVIPNGGVAINANVNATGIANGGTLTVGGGGAFSQDVYIGGNLNITGAIISNSSVQGSNSFNYLTLTATDYSLNLSTGSLVTIGGISIQAAGNATSITSGGGITIGGGAAIRKDLFVGGVSRLPNVISVNISSSNIQSNNVTSSTLNIIGVTAVNTLITSSTITNLLVTNSLNATFNSNTIGSIFTTGGNVGINTSNPSYLLDINGNLRVISNSLSIISSNTLTDVFQIQNTNSSGASSLQFLNNTGTSKASFGIGNNGTVFQNTAYLSTVSGVPINLSAGGNTAIPIIINASDNSLSITSTTTSNSVSSGSFKVSGGAGITGNLYVGGSLYVNSQVSANITNTLTSSNSTTGAFLLSGGLSINILNTANANATSYTSGGALTINGGAAISQNVYISGILDIASGSNNSNSINLQSIQLYSNSGNGTYSVIGSGNSNRTSSSFTPIRFTGWNDQSNPKMTINTTTIDIINSVNAINNTNTLGNLFTTGGNVGINSTSPGFTLDVNGTGRFTNLSSTTNTIGNLTNTNLISTNITTVNLVANLITSSSLLSTNVNSTNTTISNLLSTNVTISNLISTFNTFANNFTSLQTTGILIVTTSASLISNTNTIGSIFTTGGNVGINTTSPGFTLDVNGTGRFTNLSSTTNTIGNLTNTNLISTNITTTNLVASTVTTSSLLSTNINSTNVTASSLLSTNNTITNLISTFNTFANNLTSLQTTGTLTVTTSASLIGNTNTIGSIFTTGGNVGINTTSPGFSLDISGSTRITNSLTTGSIYSTNITSTNIVGTNIVSTNSSLGIINSTGLTTGNINFTGILYQNGIIYVGSQWTTTTGNLSYTSGSVIVSGNISSSGVISTTASLGSLSVGNVSISGNMTVGGNLIVAGTLIAVNTTSVNIIDNNISAGTLNAGSITSSNLFSTNNSLTNLISTNSSISSLNTTNLLSTNITTNSILSTNSTITNLVLISETFSNKVGGSQTTGTIVITTSASLIGNTNTIGSIFTTGGNVGINTTSPGFTLDVNGTGRFTNLTSSTNTIGNLTNTNLISTNITTTNLVGSTITTSSLLSTNVNSTNTTISNLISTFNTFANNFTSLQTTGILIVITSASLIGNTNTIGSIFTTGGNVGINTTSPGFTLDILGSTRITNSLTTGSIYSTNITSTNIVGTNIVSTNSSLGIINSTGLTTGNLNFTGLLYQNGIIYVGSQWTTTAGNLSYTSGNVIVGGLISSTNLQTTNLTAGTLNVINGLTSSNINFTGNLYQNGNIYISSQWIGTTGSLLYYGTTSNVFVGIGTSNPNYTLTVNGSISGTSLILNSTANSLNSTTGQAVFNSLSISTTQDISSVTQGGALTISGGASFGKSIAVSGGINYSGVATDIAGSFNSNNNVTTPTNVTGLLFPAANIRSFTLTISIQTSATTSLYAQYTVEGIQNGSGWFITDSYIGDNTGVLFSITNTGQIQYTSTNISGWSSTTFNYRSTSYSISANYIQSAPPTSGNYTVTGNLAVQGTTDAISSSQGSIITNGGIFVTKSINIGTGIVNNNVSVTSAGTFSAVNSQSTPANITGLLLTSATYNSFTIIMNVVLLRSSGGNYKAQYTIEGIQKDSGWFIYVSILGDTIDLAFSITTSGQLQYSSGTTYTNFTSLTFNYYLTAFYAVGGFNPISLPGGTNSTNTLVVSSTQDVVNSTTAALVVSGGASIGLNLLVGVGITVSTLLVTISAILIGNTNTVGSIFTTGGNVGINTTSPGFTLDVNGTGRFLNLTSTTNTIGNLSNTNLISVNITTANLISNVVSTGTLLSTNFNSTNATTSNLLSTNNTVTNLVSTFNTFANNFTSLQTTGTLIVTTSASLIGNTNTIGSIFTTGGNVGINTTSPGFRLDVNGTGRFNNLLSTNITTNSILATTIILTSGSFGNVSSSNISVSGNMTIGGNLLVAGTLIAVNTTSVNIIDNNITAGTLNAGSITSSNLFSTNNSLTNLISNFNTFANSISSSQTVGTLTVTTNASLTGNTNTIGSIFTTGGNVGINTTSPAFTLDVLGATRTASSITSLTGGTCMITNTSTLGSTYPLIITSPNNNNTGIILGQSQTNFNCGQVNFNYITTGSSLNTISLQAYGNQTGVYVNQNYVGINTASPNYTLDVNGSVNLNKSNNTFNKLLVLYDLNSTDSLSTATSFYGFGVNASALRYQVNSSSDTHRFYCAGTNYFVISSAGGANVSDKRFKSEIINIESAIDKIKQLQGITFKMENIEKRQMGFLAQDVKKVIPEVVHVSDTENEKDLHYLSYDKLVPLLTEGIKEQQIHIDKQQTEINEHKIQIDILLKFIKSKFPDEISP